MKNTKLIVAVIAAACLLFSGMTLAGFDLSGPKEPAYPVLQPEQITTNTLLRQILMELVKGNALRADNRCSDGDKSYSAGYVITVGKKTLRCDTENDLPAWVLADS